MPTDPFIVELIDSIKEAVFLALLFNMLSAVDLLPKLVLVSCTKKKKNHFKVHISVQMVFITKYYMRGIYVLFLSWK